MSFIPRFILAGLVVLAASANTVHAAWIDSFATGPQTVQLVGGTYPSDRITSTLDGMDTAQVFSGTRSVQLVADLEAGFRGLVNTDSISAVINGTTPGAVTCVMNIANEEGAMPYHPGVVFNYWSDTPVDWSAFDRLIVDVTTPPSQTMTLSVNLNWSTSGDEVQVTVNPGATQVEVPLSAFNGVVAAEIQGVSFEFMTAETDTFALGGFRLAGGVSRPQLDIALTRTNHVILSWPVSAAGFVAQQSPTVNPASWIDIALPCQTNATHISVAVPIVAEKGFYQLRQAQ